MFQQQPEPAYNDPTAYLPRVPRDRHSGADVRPRDSATAQTPGGGDDESPVTMINRLFAEQDPRVKPAAGPSLREVAAARLAREDAAVQRAERHQRHMDLIEAVRAWLGVACLIAVFLLITGMAVVSFLILLGYFRWAPVRPAESLQVMADFSWGLLR